MIRAELEERCKEAVTHLADGYTDTLTIKASKGRPVTRTERFPGLLAQLRTRAADPYATRAGSGPSGNPNKGASRPPVDQGLCDLVDTIGEGAERLRRRLEERVIMVTLRPVVPRSPEGSLKAIRGIVASGLLPDEDLTQAVRSLTAMVSRCRQALGLEARRVVLADATCHGCGGALGVAEDASTDVECLSGCGVTYARTEWLRIMREQDRCAD